MDKREEITLTRYDFIILIIAIFSTLLGFILNLFFVYIPMNRTERKIELVSEDLELAVTTLIKIARDIENNQTKSCGKKY